MTTKKVKQVHGYPDPYNLEVLRSKSPPLWDSTKFPIHNYESHRQLLTYNQFLDCPTGDGGHLEFQERSGTMRVGSSVGNGSRQIACIHRCTRCGKHWAIHDAEYPRLRHFYADMAVKLRESDSDR